MLELNLVNAMGLLILYLMFQVAYRSLLNTKDNGVGMRNEELTLFVAANDILHVGRLARKCVKEPVTHECEVALGCEIDLDIPPRGKLSTVRFCFNGHKLSVLTQLNGISKVLREHAPLSLFDLCDDSEIVHSQCSHFNGGQERTIDSLIEKYSKNMRGRFFRFRLSVRRQKRVSTLQSAFFVRNPSPYSGTLYQVNGDLRNP